MKKKFIKTTVLSFAVYGIFNVSDVYASDQDKDIPSSSIELDDILKSTEDNKGETEKPLGNNINGNEELNFDSKEEDVKKSNNIEEKSINNFNDNEELNIDSKKETETPFSNELDLGKDNKESTEIQLSQELNLNKENIQSINSIKDGNGNNTNEKNKEKTNKELLDNNKSDKSILEEFWRKNNKLKTEIEDVLKIIEKFKNLYVDSFYSGIKQFFDDGRFLDNIIVDIMTTTTNMTIREQKIQGYIMYYINILNHYLENEGLGLSDRNDYFKAYIEKNNNRNNNACNEEQEEQMKAELNKNLNIILYTFEDVYSALISLD